MPFLSDGDSSCSEGRSNANHQRRELTEGESSRSWELSALLYQRSYYNLRPRKDDSDAIEKRFKFARWMEQRTKRRIERKEAEALEQKELREYFERASKRMKEVMDRLPVREPRKVDMENRTEIINADTMNTEKWHPYFEVPDFGLLKSTLKGVSWAVEELALQVASTVVGLRSFTDEHTDHFFCSGTIFESSGKFGKIVTVANLVKKCPDTDELAEGLKITVYLQNHETCSGRLLYHDFFYNICVIEIQYPVHLPNQGFISNTEAISFDKNCSKDVVTLGRDEETHGLVVNTGKIIPKSSSFNCEELLVSTCRISKAVVGGPLMSFDGNFIGLNYYHNKETPFIPSFIVLKCLLQLKLFRKVVRPLPGLQVRTIFTEGRSAFEKMQTNLLRTTGVIIEKIEDQSSVKASGLNEGDIINRVNGVYFSSAAELGGILLDIGTAYQSDYQNFKQPDGSDMMPICIKFGVRGHEDEKTVDVDKFACSGVNRWPFPKPIIIRKYSNGEKIDEEWYAVES